MAFEFGLMWCEAFARSSPTLLCLRAQACILRCPPTAAIASADSDPFPYDFPDGRAWRTEQQDHPFAADAVNVEMPLFPYMTTPSTTDQR